MLTKNLLTYSKLYKYLNFSHIRIQDCMAEWSRAQKHNSVTFLCCGSQLTATSWCLLQNTNDFFFEGFPRLSRVQIPAGNAHFPAAFSSHATYARGSLWGSWIPPGGWGVAESCGNSFKLRNRLKLCSKKSFKIELFKIPSWEFKNIFFLVYPHQTRAPYTPCIPPNFKGHF